MLGFFVSLIKGGRALSSMNQWGQTPLKNQQYVKSIESDPIGLSLSCKLLEQFYVNLG